MVTTTHGPHLVMGLSSPGDPGGNPGQAISSSIQSFAASRAAAWASAGDAARFRNGTTIPLCPRGSWSGFQTSTLAENLVSTAVSGMRIFQPLDWKVRWTLSFQDAIDIAARCRSPYPRHLVLQADADATRPALPGRIVTEVP
jgi:hypothetical protein